MLQKSTTSLFVAAPALKMPVKSPLLVEHKKPHVAAQRRSMYMSAMQGSKSDKQDYSLTPAP